jgi:hypothetical protein
LKRILEILEKCNNDVEEKWMFNESLYETSKYNGIDETLERKIETISTEYAI